MFSPHNGKCRSGPASPLLFFFCSCSKTCQKLQRGKLSFVFFSKYFMLLFICFHLSIAKVGGPVSPLVFCSVHVTRNVSTSRPPSSFVSCSREAWEGHRSPLPPHPFLACTKSENREGHRGHPLPPLLFFSCRYKTKEPWRGIAAPPTAPPPRRSSSSSFSCRYKIREPGWGIADPPSSSTFSCRYKIKKPKGGA